MKSHELIAKQHAMNLSADPDYRPSRAESEEIILAAIREAVSQLPGDMPVTAQRMEVLEWEREYFNAGQDAGVELEARRPSDDDRKSWREDFADLFAVIEHQRQFIAFLLSETEGQALCRGYDMGQKAGFVLGAKAQKRKMVAVADAAAYATARDAPAVMEAMEATPLASPPW
jgi:hypothetical protein